MKRKSPEGPLRNKERTRHKLLNAVGEILRTEGHRKLGVNHIARTADVDKRLIYRYFGNGDNLIERYVRSNDFWLAFNDRLNELMAEHQADHGKELGISLMERLLQHLEEVPEAREIFLWELSSKSRVLKDVCRSREKMGGTLFQLTDPLFTGSAVDIRAIYALLLGGVYYLTLHARTCGGSVCGVNIKEEAGKKRIMTAVRYMVDSAYADQAV